MRKAVLGYVQDGNDIYSQKKAISRSFDEYDGNLQRMRSSSDAGGSTHPQQVQYVQDTVNESNIRDAILGSGNNDIKPDFTSPGGKDVPRAVESG